MKNLVGILFTLLASSCNAFPEENNDDKGGLLFASDMMLTPLQRILVETGGDISLAGRASGRAAMSNVSTLWLPNNKIVPYTIDDTLENIAEATFGIMQGLREWEERSCLTFKRRTAEVDYIAFFKENGCWSYVGRQGGKQNISLDDGCWGRGTVVHEIGHAMGFGHEQNRPDRDNFITIRWENIPEKKKHNFQKYSNSEVDSLGSRYDYKSFMQYSKTAFGYNGSTTLDPKDNNVFQLGQRVGFTKSDQEQVMKLYRCNGKTTRKAAVFEKYNLKGDDVCDFERNMCHYTQDSSDDFDWIRKYGGTPSDDTGPETDHTTQRMGTYVYIEASVPRVKGDKARMMTKFFPATMERQCLSFFLHMFSTNKTMMGEFNVYLIDDVNKDGLLIFSQIGSQKMNDWNNIQRKFKPTGRYQIVFEGIRGNNYQGDIALDDISFTRRKCNPTAQFAKVAKLEVAADCKDTNDREGQYCSQWKKEGYCTSREKDMKRFCSKTCELC